MEREIKFSKGENLESAVYTLLAAKARGKKVYGKFYGHILHSETVSMDSAYMEVLGCTKAEYDKQIKKWRENYKKEEKLAEQRAIQNIPKWIEKGQTLIYPERYEEWEKCVNTYAANLYHGLELNSALEIMQALENGTTIEEASKMLNNQKHSSMTASLVRNIIFSFSSKGPEFWEATAHGKISSKNKALLEAKKQENIQLATNICKKNAIGTYKNHHDFYYPQFKLIKKQTVTSSNNFPMIPLEKLSTTS